MPSQVHAKPVKQAFLQFYGALNDFLPKNRQGVNFPYQFTNGPSVKDVIEAIGVPHVEVDLILVNGYSVAFNHNLRGKEKIEIYPRGEAPELSPLVHLSAKPLPRAKFIIDVNLGKLARKLRLLGFDSRYGNDLQDRDIVEQAIQEQRIILTRDKGILKYGSVTHGYWLRSDDPKRQVNEVMKHFQLLQDIQPFTLCSSCGGPLVQVDAKQLMERLPQDTRQQFKLFMECQLCRQLYWQGSHYTRICNWIKKLKHLCK